MTTNHPASARYTANPNLFQHLWQLITRPIGDKTAIQSDDRQASNSLEKKAPASKTRNPELAPPAAAIGASAFKEFADYAEGDEPTDLALLDLIPAELALLNLPGTQPKQQSKKSFAEVADTLSTHALTEESLSKESFDDEQYLADLIPLELSELSEDTEKTLPDLSSFDSALINS